MRISGQTGLGIGKWMQEEQRANPTHPLNGRAGLSREGHRSNSWAKRNSWRFPFPPCCLCILLVLDLLEVEVAISLFTRRDRSTRLVNPSLSATGTRCLRSEESRTHDRSTPYSTHDLGHGVSLGYLYSTTVPTVHPLEVG